MTPAEDKAVDVVRNAKSSTKEKPDELPVDTSNVFSATRDEFNILLSTIKWS